MERQKAVRVDSVAMEGWERGSCGQKHRSLWARGLVALACLLTAVGVGAPSPAHAAVAKGLTEPSLDAGSAGEPRSATIREIRHGLGARWVRVSVGWAELQPARDEYSAEAVNRLDTLVDSLHASGVRIVLTAFAMPSWASQSYWWSHPPSGHAPGPQPFYPIDGTALGEFGDLGEFLARRYAGKAQALEVWNEPNLWTFLYPQRTPDDPSFAARTYLRMLKAYHAGVERAHTGVRVVAGATAPIGLNDAYRTSPQRFARFLKRARAGRYFDIYSHHPYTPGGSIRTAPDRLPNDPTKTVTLANLGTLLRLFPGKPFYLTEYGYNTGPAIRSGSPSTSASRHAT